MNLKTGVSRKQSTPYFLKKEHFLPSDTCVSGGKKCSFFGEFSMLCFFETPVLRFALLPYYRRYVSQIFYKIFSILYMGGFGRVQFLSLCLKIFRLASFFRSLGSFLPGIRLYIAEFFCSYISSRNGDTRDISLLETF